MTFISASVLQRTTRPRRQIDLPKSLAWLWRGYDPNKTSEQFTIDPAEREKPYYRVTISNRDSW